MVYKKESLEKLLLLIDEICGEQEHLWFREQLMEQLSGKFLDAPQKKSNDFGPYFMLLKKQFKIKANKFYEETKDQNLKKELVQDCIKMFWYQVNNDINQTFVLAFYQMENLLNFYLVHSNCFEKVNLNKDYYTHTISSTFIIVCSKQFLDLEGNKKIEKINIWAKIVYWAYESGNKDFLIQKNSNFSNLVNIRNQNNHRNSIPDQSSNSKTIYNKNIVDSLKSGDFAVFGYYTSILKKIATSINTIDKKVEKKIFEHTTVNPAKPKVVDFIDPETLNRRR